LNARIAFLIIVLALNVATALGVVYARHESRQLASRLGELEQQRDNAMADWSRLQIEQSHLADAGQIEDRARNELGMRDPEVTRILVVSP